MKKAILIIVIFSLLAISLTYTLIKTEQNKKEEYVVPKEIVKNDINLTIEDETKKEILEDDDYKSIIIGESKYFENPIEIIKYNTINLSEESGTFKRDHNFIQISGLKNKNIEQKINNKITNSAVKIIKEHEQKSPYYKMDAYVEGNFSNVISIRLDYENNFLNLNMVDGEELTIDDYLKGKDEIKDVLTNYLTKCLMTETGLNASIESKTGSFVGYYGDDLTYIKYTDDDLIQINSFLEKTKMRLMNMYEHNKFDFGFSDSSLYLVFDLSKIRENEKENEIGIVIPEKITCRIPIYEIIDSIRIYDSYSENWDIYEDEISKEQYVGIKDFQKINDNFWCYNQIADEQELSYFDEDVDIYNEIQEKAQNQIDELKKETNKNIVVINRICYSQFSGYYYTCYTLKYDKHASSEQIDDVHKLMMSYDDVNFESFIDGSLSDLSEKLKEKYKDLEYTLETKDIHIFF